MKRLSIVVDGKTVSVRAQRLGKQIWFHHEGKIFCVEPEIPQDHTARQRGGGAGRGGARGGDVVAPMPGKVVKVLAHEKMHVTGRQPLVVMEAMKMEYTLESTGPGVVQQVRGKVGDQVQMGQVLVKIEREIESAVASAGSTSVKESES